MKINHFFSMGTHVGDWLYARCQQALLKFLDPNIEIEEFPLAANHPYWEDKGITAERLASCDLAIIGGGPIYFFRHPNAWRPFIGDVKAVENCQTPIIVWSTGLDVADPNAYGFIGDPKMKLIRAVHYRAEGIAVRDQLTASFLETFNYEPKVTGDAAHLVGLIPVDIDIQDRLTFVYRKDMGEDRLDEIKAWCRHFVAKGHRIQFLCLSAHDVDDIKSIPHTEVFVPGLDVQQFLTQLYKSLAVVSFRMHASIPAAVQYIPTLLYWNGSRGLGWSQFAGLTDWNEPIEGFSADTCIEKTEQMLAGDFCGVDRSLVLRVYEDTKSWLMEFIK